LTNHRVNRGNRENPEILDRMNRIYRIRQMSLIGPDPSDPVILSKNGLAFSVPSVNSVVKSKNRYLSLHAMGEMMFPSASNSIA
jgi:hypothetical protein